MKNILSIAIAFTLTSSVIAGGDDRDKGPIESLDTITAPVSATPTPIVSAPNAEQFTGGQKSEIPKLSVGGKIVSVRAHIACQEKLGLSESNIAIFRKAQAGGYLYNTGPIEILGTMFSPERWDAYFSCVDKNGG